MNIKVGLWISVLCTCCPGCSPLANSVRTLIIEPTEYCRRIDNKADEKRGYALAEAYWDEFRQASPQTLYSDDFARGFKDGFADYLYAGGSGNPPPVAPRWYWRPEYENPQGHRAIEDWYAGFRRGAVMAQGSGYRQWVTVPASTALPARMPPMPPSRTKEPAKEEFLPSPKKVAPGSENQQSEVRSPKRGQDS